VKVTLALPEVHRLNEVQTRFCKIRLHAAHTGEKMVTDKYAARGARVRRPPTDAENMLVKVREDLVEKLPPDRYINLQSSGESAFRRLSCRVFPTEAFDICRCHSTTRLIALWTLALALASGSFERTFAR
jgi:hypothetical protein